MWNQKFLSDPVHRFVIWDEAVNKSTDAPGTGLNPQAPAVVAETGVPASRLTAVSPLQRIAMGLVLIFGSAQFPAEPHPAWEHYDALPDPIGWVLVLLGVRALARSRPHFDVVGWPAWTAAAVSVPLWFPQLTHRLSDPGSWALSLPQLVFCFLLARSIAEQAEAQRPADTYVSKRFGLLMWAFAVAAVLPPIAIGGGVAALDTTTVAVNYVIDIAFVYYLFRVHRREWLGGPGPLMVKPAVVPGKDEGRPPSP